MRKCARCSKVSETRSDDHCYGSRKTCHCICTDRGWIKWCKGDNCSAVVFGEHSFCDGCYIANIKSVISEDAFNFFMNKIRDLEDEIASLQHNRCCGY